MNIKLVAVLAAVGSLLACGDSGTGGAGGGSGGSPPAGGGPAGGEAPGGGNAGGGGGGVALTCETGCQLLFDCGLEGTPPYCVYVVADEPGFVPECIAGCEDSPALLSLLTDDCEGNITTIKAVNADFKTFCEDGASAGGAGGGA